MTHYINYVKDSVGNNYLGIDIEPGLVQPYLNELKDLIGEDDFKIYTELKGKRDLGKYHITVINVMDYNRLAKEMGMDAFINSLEPVFDYEIDDLELLGIGSATKNENRAYYIVCKSDKLDAVRKRFNLPEFDFHITLGFKDKDVHGVRKNVVITKNEKFLKLLKSEYYKKDNWNFIKEIGNFDLDKEAEVIPIEIKEDSFKVECDGHILNITLLDDEKFWISNKYPVEDNQLQRMTHEDVVRILDKN